jgi:bifunctional DNA-binding transcriptional regulator/antitoxin component of YhaV-PrlF toxin-antitoxin module
MSTVVLSSKRQVVLPAELCRQLSLAPGSPVRVELAPDGAGMLVLPARDEARKPASVLFDRIVHRGSPIAVEQMQGLAAARRLAGKARG